MTVPDTNLGLNVWLLMLLVIINSVIMLGAWKILFGSWEEFRYCLSYIAKPNWFSFMESEYAADFNATLKIGIFIALIPALFFAEFWILPNAWTGGQRDAINQRFAERASQDELRERIDNRGFQILRAGEAYGPYPYKEMKWMIIRGEMFNSDLVRWYGQERWVTVKQLKSTAHIFPATTTTTNSTENESP